MSPSALPGGCGRSTGVALALVGAAGTVPSVSLTAGGAGTVVGAEAATGDELGVRGDVRAGQIAPDAGGGDCGGSHSSQAENSCSRSPSLLDG